MEPYDFPDNDPGPQTLLTSLSADQNMDRLYWHLSRMQGYAGLTNFMGARFVATDAAMQPIIREAAKRGLGFSTTAPRPAASRRRPRGARRCRSARATSRSTWCRPRPRSTAR
jgi:polysaccharide deacetylase 2 family uncharacterized protein YibQ